MSTDSALGLQQLQRLGLWSFDFRSPTPRTLERLPELRESGWRTYWVPGAGGDTSIWDDAGRILTRTQDASVSFGVANIWGADADTAGERFAQLTSEFGDRLVAGFGVGNPAAAASAGKRYGNPVKSMTAFLDQLDRHPRIPPRSRLIGALGPKMTELGGLRASGVHPFLVTPSAVETTRALVPPTTAIAPYVPVVLTRDPRRAREQIRNSIGMFIGFPTYQANLRRSGFGDDDLVPGGSDRMIDALSAWGDIDTIDAKLGAYFRAGATHIALHLLGDSEFERGDARELSALIDRDASSETPSST